VPRLWCRGRGGLGPASLPWPQCRASAAAGGREAPRASHACLRLSACACVCVRACVRGSVEGVSEEEAIRLINIDPVAVTSKPATKGRGGADVFTMGDDGPAPRSDPFDELLSGMDVRGPSRPSSPRRRGLRGWGWGGGGDEEPRCGLVRWKCWM
jgi:hypothetical protein